MAGNVIQGHGIILNMDSFLPFVFEFNPTSVDTEKKINYVMAPNIGGSHKKRYFTGFDNREATFSLTCIDKESPLGVLPQVSYFEQLREPSSGLFGFANLFNNTNYPPPQILFQFGISMIPLVWDVLDVKINTHHFHDGHITGLFGIPKMAEITLKLGLDETDSLINKMNKIAEKATAIYGSVESIIRESTHKASGITTAFSSRKEYLYPPTISRSGW